MNKPKFPGIIIFSGSIYYDYRAKIAVVGSCFYEQYSCGFILRSWKNHQLGINNALRDSKLKFSP